MITLNHLHKSYDNFSLDCTLAVKPGTITGLVGRNGSGKTTTFKALLGLIQPDGGKATLLGKPCDDLTPEDRQNVGVVLSGTNFSKEMTISDIEKLLTVFYDHFDSALFHTLCKQYNLPLKKKTKDFSTGMVAKLKLIMAMTHGARLLILDEPTAGLDVIARDELLDLLRDFMLQSEDRAILISSHISSDLEHLCDDFYIIDNGSIVFHEDTDVLLANYGVLKVNEDDYAILDKTYLLCNKKTSYGYECLTNQKQFYLENNPSIAIESANIDSAFSLMIKGA